MSFTLFCPALLLLYYFSRSFARLTLASITAYATLCLIATGGYVWAASRTAPSANRFQTIMDYYGAKDRGGWTTLSDFYKQSGQIENYHEVLKTADSLYPEYRTL